VLFVIVALLYGGIEATRSPGGKRLIEVNLCRFAEGKNQA